MSKRTMDNSVLSRFLNILTGSALLLGLPVHGQAPGLKKAPLSPVFQQWRDQHIPRGLPGPLGGTQEGGPRVRGRIPSPLDLSHVRGPVFPQSPKLTYPAFFDLRTTGVMTPVKDQGQYGTCWAFACMGSLEASTLKAGVGCFDLSEWYQAYYAYKPFNSSLMVAFTSGSVGQGEDPVFDQGGNDLISAALLARGNGAVNEKTCPYQTGSYRPEPIPAGDLPNGRESVSVPLEEALYLFSSDTPSSAGDLKYAITHYGPAVISMDWEDANFDTAMSTYRDPKATVADLNHEVCIVGWNDHFETCRFPASNRPSKPGAWIVRNSWGRSWGLNGYFYLSYDSKLFDGTVFVGGPRTTQRIHQYDPLGWCASVGFGSPTAWAANAFLAPQDEKVTAVSFYSASACTRYSIELRVAIGNDPSLALPMGAPLASPQTGTLLAPGYHIINLATPVAVPKGAAFAVVLKLTTPGYHYPIPVQGQVDGYSNNSATHHDRSFISADGVTWYDLAPTCQGQAVCLKAFASN